MGLQNNIENIGYVKKGMKLVNSSGTAECTVNDVELFSDEKGDLIFSLHIPDPKISGNPLFTTGNNTIRVTTSATNASILDPGSSSAEAEYLASGYQTSTQEQSLSIKTPQVERVQVGTEEVSRTFNRERTEVTQNTTQATRTTRRGGGGNRPRGPSASQRRRDPLAQSFLIYPDVYPNGIFITSGEISVSYTHLTLPTKA